MSFPINCELVEFSTSSAMLCAPVNKAGRSPDNHCSISLLAIGKLPQVAPLTGQSPCTEGIGLWHALWGDTSAMFISFCLCACLPYLSAGTHYDRLRSDGQSTGALVYIKSPWVRGRRRGHHPASHRMPFNERSFFLAMTAIELALLLGYGRSPYTGN